MWASLLSLLGLITLPACTTRNEPATATWPVGDPVIRGAPPLAYLTNSGDDTISVVSLATMQAITSKPVGIDIVEPEAPHHLAIDREGGYLFVGLSNVLPSNVAGIHGSHGGGTRDGFVTRLALETLSPTGFVRVPSNLGDLIFCESTRKIVTTHFNLTRAIDPSITNLEDRWAEVTVVDADALTREPPLKVGLAPHGATFVENGSSVVVASYGDDQLAVVDLGATTTPSLVERVPIGSLAQVEGPPHYGPYAIVPHPDGSRIFVGNTDSRDVRVFDVRSRTMVSGVAIDAGGAAFFGAFSDDGERYYVPTQSADALLIIDTTTYNVLATRPLGPSECLAPHVVAHPPGDRRIYLVCEGNRRDAGALLAIDAETLDIEASIPVGVYPNAIAIATEVTW